MWAPCKSAQASSTTGLPGDQGRKTKSSSRMARNQLSLDVLSTMDACADEGKIVAQSVPSLRGPAAPVMTGAS